MDTLSPIMMPAGCEPLGSTAGPGEQTDSAVALGLPARVQVEPYVEVGTHTQPDGQQASTVGVTGQGAASGR